MSPDASQPGAAASPSPGPLLSREDPVDALAALLRDCDARVTFDPERNITHPCFACGTTRPRTLVDLPVVGRDITRPFCAACVETGKPAAMTEREVDARTVLRLLSKLKEGLDARDELRRGIETQAATIRGLESMLADYRAVARGRL